jgi:hypothetical protein
LLFLISTLAKWKGENAVNDYPHVVPQKLNPDTAAYRDLTFGVQHADSPYAVYQQGRQVLELIMNIPFLA